MQVLWLLNMLQLGVAFTCTSQSCRIPPWHMDPVTLLNGQVIPPSSHPKMDPYYRNGDFRDSDGDQFEDKDHPNVDRYMQQGLWPSRHPNIRRTYQPTPFTYSPKIVLPFWHPQCKLSFENGWKVPTPHKNISSMFAVAGYEWFNGHTDLNVIYSSPRNYSLPYYGHPDFEKFLTYQPKPAVKVSPALPFWHPNVTEAFEKKAVIPPGHPEVNSMFVTSFGSSWPASHPDISTLFSGNTPYPVWHPNIDEYFQYLPEPSLTSLGYALGYIQLLPWYHPPLLSSLRYKLPPGHPVVHSLFPAALISPSHTNLDSLFGKSSALPTTFTHPGVDKYFRWQSKPSINPVATVSFFHPGLTETYKNRIPIPSSHPRIHPYFAAELPPGHPNIDTLLANPDAYPWPEWHPDIDEYVRHRGQFAPGFFLAIFMASLLVIAVTWRFANGYLARANLKMLSDKQFKLTDQDLQMMNKPASATEFEAVQETNGRKSVWMRNVDDKKGPPPPPPVPPSLPPPRMHNRPPQTAPRPPPPRNRTIQQMNQLNAGHREELYDYGAAAQLPSAPPEVVKPPVPILAPAFVVERLISEEYELGHSHWHALWVTIWSKRVPKTQWTTGNVLFLLGYIGLNLGCIWVADSINQRGEVDFGRGFGSLAAANTMILIIPATRNSVLTWLLGLSFDRVIIYHRMCARMALFFVLIHFLLFVSEWVGRPDDFVFLTGFFSGLCGFIIFVTTLDWVRRKHFNVFFFSHYVFIGFITLGYFHTPEAQPFLLTGAGFYIFDLFLRTLWKILPRRLITFKPKGDNIAQVRFPKNPLTRLLRMHSVGQYYFVNFPQLSLSEWHPFSVSSGPDEDGVELHIRALGDHTTQINKYVRECASRNYLPYIRFDGPYGHQDFNFRRYPVLLLAGGGVGITPIMGMLKDIYRYGSFRHGEQSLNRPHAIETVYALWVMPNYEDYACFEQEFNTIMRHSQLPQFPPLVVWIYVTRAKKDDPKLAGKPHLIAGRPKMPEILDTMQQNHAGKATLGFACGPGAMVNELWDQSVARSSKGARFDFHHEIFEF